MLHPSFCNLPPPFSMTLVLGTKHGYRICRCLKTSLAPLSFLLSLIGVRFLQCCLRVKLSKLRRAFVYNVFEPIHSLSTCLRLHSTAVEAAPTLKTIAMLLTSLRLSIMDRSWGGCFSISTAVGVTDTKAHVFPSSINLHPRYSEHVGFC